MNKLAYVGQITKIEPVTGADKIVRAEVNCVEGGSWSGVVQKDQFKTGDLCIVYLQDALLKPDPSYAFLEKWHWRIKMQRLRGVPSECLIMPYHLPNHIQMGADITDFLGVSKYEKPIPMELSGQAVGGLPHGIPMTDEPNFQKVPDMVAALVGRPYYMSEKADGTSGTWYWYNGTFGCCGRNYEYKESEGNVFWRLARKYGVMGSVNKNVALQFEAVGPSIQDNNLKLTEIEARGFTLFDIDRHEYLGLNDLRSFLTTIKVPMVRILNEGDSFVSTTNDELRKLAEIKYLNGGHAEGVVIRPKIEDRVNNERLSFKIINLLYKN